MKRYKSFVENNRRLGQEANAFGNEALGRQERGMKGKGWRRWGDKAKPNTARETVTVPRQRGNCCIYLLYFTVGSHSGK